MTTPPHSPTEPAGPPTGSGVDLARAALRAAQETARARPAQPSSRSRRRPSQRTGRRDGREPNPLGVVVQAWLRDRGLTPQQTTTDVAGQWPTLAEQVDPKLAEHVAVARFRPDTGQLDLVPNSPAAATQTRYLLRRLEQAATELFGPDIIRTIRLLPPGTALPARPEVPPQPQAARPHLSPTPASAPPAGPLVPAEYRQARQALASRAHAPHTDASARRQAPAGKVPHHTRPAAPDETRRSA